jgi:hypothetical protein
VTGRYAPAALLLVSCVALGACANEAPATMVRPQTIIPPRVLGVDEIGADRYASAVPRFSGVEVAPGAPSVSPTSSLQPTAAALQGLAEQGDLDCARVGDMAVEMSALAQQSTGSAAIVSVLDTRLLEDWSASVTVPVEGKVPVLKCWARVRWSEGSESDVSLWLLLDSSEDLRVRWDEIANVKQGQ